MADPTTATIGLAQPTRNSDVGTWDTPMNGNASILDLIAGGIATIGLNNSNVVLSAAQFQCEEIVFNSTLTGSVTITFPTSFTKPYSIQNLCTGSSAFTVTLTTTAAGGQAIGCPPGEMFEVRNDGTNIKFKNLGRVGSYWDHCGSSVPNWVPACTTVPYLNCDGTTFSSASFPVLAGYLGGNTLPDFRGRVRGYLNQGTGRITTGTSLGGVDGNTLAAAGGQQIILLSSKNLPSTALNEPSSGHFHTTPSARSFPNNQLGGGGGNVADRFDSAGSNNASTNVTTGITFGSSAPTNFSVLPPMAIGGLTLIRAG